MIWAIIGLVVVGLSWTLAGIVMGSAPKKGLAPELVQFFSALIPLVVGTIVLNTCGIAPVEWDDPQIQKGVLLYIAGSIENFLFLQLLSYTMQKGPNGVIWSINQSGMFLCFLFGLVFHGDVLNTIRIIGIVMLLTALLLLGLARDNSNRPGSRRWVLLAFSGMLLCGIGQIIQTYPSYIPEVRQNLNVITRSVIVSSTTLVCALIWNLSRNRKAFFEKLQAHLKNKYLWIFVGSLQAFGLISSYFILYRSMDTLSASGIGSASYPILVASCLVGFSLYSRFFLKERTNAIQTTGLILCTLGIVAICIK